MGYSFDISLLGITYIVHGILLRTARDSKM